jgi:ATP-dependent Clp protease ATP-binding subunit ClpA
LRARAVVGEARELAVRRNQEVTPWHLLSSMADDPLVLELVGDGGRTLARGQLQNVPDVDPEFGVQLSVDARMVLDDAESFADELGDPHVGVEHLLAGLGGCGFLPDGLVEDEIVRAVAARRRALRIVERQHRTPLDDLTREQLLGMEPTLHRRIVGQERAVRALSNTIRRASAGLSDPNRPFGSFLFLGPTGVGKTELAKTLAEFLYGSERLMTRLDMSEYREGHSTARLIGSPPGYVGYQEGGQLTNAIEKEPQSLVLLDEMEKAHENVLNVMLQVLDDGHLTDAHGKTVDFKQCVVVMTSNVGSQLYQSKLQGKDLRAAVLDELWARFRPEFLNRIDEMIVFDQLTDLEFVRIADLQLAPVIARMSERGIRLDVSDEVKAYLVEGGRNPILGARQMRRFIQREVQDTLAQELLRHGWTHGCVTADLIDGKVGYVWKS